MGQGMGRSLSSCSGQGWGFSLSPQNWTSKAEMINTPPFPQRVPIVVGGKVRCLKISPSHLIKSNSRESLFWVKYCSHLEYCSIQDKLTLSYDSNNFPLRESVKRKGRKHINEHLRNAEEKCPLLHQSA